MSPGRKWPRPQVSITTMLWLTLCVACFFSGRYWDRIAKAALAAATPPVLASGTLRTSDIQIVSGRTASIESNVSINRLLVADPTIASISPETQTTFTVTAKQAGTTEIVVSDESGNSVIYALSVM
jgi:Flp pilus assembly secretin CpaC